MAVDEGDFEAELKDLHKMLAKLTPAERSRAWEMPDEPVIDRPSGINVALPIGRAEPGRAAAVLSDEEAYARIVALREQHGLPPIPREVDEVLTYIM